MTRPIGGLRLSDEAESILIGIRDRDEHPRPGDAVDELVAKGLLVEVEFVDEPLEYRITSRGQAAIEQLKRPPE